MYGIIQLKNSIKISPNNVECPVKGCLHTVVRQRKAFKLEERFKCPQHNIYISFSTWEYPREGDNMLWKNKMDLKLFCNIKEVKRESRIARDNSEDALTWNVFRFLERNQLVNSLLNQIVCVPVINSEVIYWSYSRVEQKQWSILNKARIEFGETIKRGSEPDIIIRTDKVLFFIEAKFTSGNETTPSNKDNAKKYLTGADNWFSKVFHSNYQTIAVENQKYELLRFWLLGTWMAKQLNLKFYLINLVRSGYEKDIESIFGKYIVEDETNKFKRLSWEEINYWIQSVNTPDKEIIINYFKNKAIGYDRNGNLQKAFTI